MVQVVLDRQNLSCGTRWQNFASCQRDVLGATGFCTRSALVSLYAADLADLASKFGVNLHAFADDNQLHVHCDLSSVLSSVNALVTRRTVLHDLSVLVICRTMQINSHPTATPHRVKALSDAFA